MAKKNKAKKLKFQPAIRTHTVVNEVVLEAAVKSKDIEVKAKYPDINILGVPPKPISVKVNCSKDDYWKLKGQHTTGRNGQIRFNLAQFLNCIPIDFSDDDWYFEKSLAASKPMFLATAESAEPVFMTYEMEVSRWTERATIMWDPLPGLNVVAIVYSWNHDGTPAPLVDFSWMASAKATKVQPLV